MLTVAAEDLNMRLGAALGTAEKACARASLAVTDSRMSCVSSVNLRRRSIVSRADSRPHRRWFRLEGHVDATPVVAVLTDDHVIADDALLSNARIVVAMGESFPRENGDDIQASLDGPPIAVMLTLVRACSCLTSVRLGPAEHPDLWSLESPSTPAPG